MCFNNFRDKFDMVDLNKQFLDTVVAMRTMLSPMFRYVKNVSSSVV